MESQEGEKVYLLRSEDQLIKNHLYLSFTVCLTIAQMYNCALMMDEQDESRYSQPDLISQGFSCQLFGLTRV